jgi:hypothetical protein
LAHADIAQTSTYLGASIGNDDAAMRAYEERIGRVAKAQASESTPATTGSNEQRSLPVGSSATIH